MKCKDMERGLEEYLDGALSKEKKTEFDSHLAGCDACRDTLRRRERMGDGLSRSLQRLAGGREPAAELLERILAGAAKEKKEKLYALRPWPRLAAAAILPLLALGLCIVLLQKGKSRAPAPALPEQGQASYFILTTTHFTGPASEKWSAKRVYIKRSNGGEGSLTLELINKTEEQKGGTK